LTFIHCLAAVSHQTPALLSSDLAFPQLESSVSLQEIFDFSRSAQAASALKRKRVFKFPTTTLRPFASTIVTLDEGAGKKMRYQRRGGASLTFTGAQVTGKEKQGKKVEVKSKADALREQKALLSMAAVQARQTQRRLDIQSGNLEAGTEEAVSVSEARKGPVATAQVVPIQEILDVPAPVPLLEQVSNVTHLNLSLSSASLLSPLPSLSSPPLLPPSPSLSSALQLTGIEEQEGAETGGGYEDDFEVESRASSRSSRRCLTPHLALVSSRPSSGAGAASPLERLRSPARPDGPAPSRRSFRER
jgi:hypothetical protein